jgi:hypothetical protein
MPSKSGSKKKKSAGGEDDTADDMENLRKENHDLEVQLRVAMEKHAEVLAEVDELREQVTGRDDIVARLRVELLAKPAKPVALVFSLSAPFDSKKEECFSDVHLMVPIKLRGHGGYEAHLTTPVCPAGQSLALWVMVDSIIVAAFLAAMDADFKAQVRVLGEVSMCSIWTEFQEVRGTFATQTEDELLLSQKELVLSAHDTMRLYVHAHGAIWAKLLQVRGLTADEATAEQRREYWRVLLKGIDTTSFPPEVSVPLEIERSKAAETTELKTLSALDLMRVGREVEAQLNAAWKRLGQSAAVSQQPQMQLGLAQHQQQQQQQQQQQPQQQRQQQRQQRSSQRRQQQQPSRSACARCGIGGHDADTCRFDKECFWCGGKGHIQEVCEHKKGGGAQVVQHQQQSQSQQRSTQQRQFPQQQQQQQQKQQPVQQYQQQRPPVRQYQQQQQQNVQQQQFYQQPQQPQQQQQQQQFSQQFVQQPQQAQQQFVQQQQPYAYPQQTHQQQQQQFPQQQATSQQWQQLPGAQSSFLNQEYPGGLD